MKIFARGEFTWVKNSLWYKDDYLLAIVEDTDITGMFWIEFNDGTKSDDYYNYTRAKEHAIRITLSEFNKQVLEDIL